VPTAAVITGTRFGRWIAACRDQQTDLTDVHSGGRALEAVVRPYPRAVAGEPLRMAFDIRKKTFFFEFRHDPEIEAPTEIFVPNYQYPEGYAVEVSDGSYEIPTQPLPGYAYHLSN